MGHLMADISFIPTMTSNRFDIAYKISFLKNLVYSDCRFYISKKYYYKNIEAMTLGRFKESDYSYKKTIEDYEKHFIDLFKNINSLGFDANISKIHFSSNGTIRNGAHRTSICIFLQKPIIGYISDEKQVNYNYKYFQNLGFDKTDLDYGARIYTEFSNDLYFAILWPVANGFQNIFEAEFDVIIKKEVILNENGFLNLIKLIYSGENWLNDSSDLGLISKFNNCYIKDIPLTIYLIQCNSFEELIKKKNHVRAAIKIDKSSLHITDTLNEVKILQNYLLYENSLNAMNEIPWDIKLNNNFSSKLEFYIEKLNQSGLNKNDFALDSGMVLALFGLRNADDIDYISIDDSVSLTGLNSHNNLLNYHRKSADELIYNEQNYFIYSGVKFLTLKNVLYMKMNRDSIKDKIDISLIQSKINGEYNHRSHFNFLYLKRLLFKFYLLVRLGLYHLLMKIGLYVYMKKIYNKIKNFK